MSISREQFDKFIDGLPHRPNDFQLKILDSIAFGSGNKLVSALAGSGKTSLLVMTAKLLQLMGTQDAIYLAFNVKIKDELNERLPKGYSAINSHSLGMQMCKQVNPSARVDNKKWFDITKDVVAQLFVPREKQFAEARKLQSLCSKVMLNNTDPDDLEAVAAIAEHYAIEVSGNIIAAVGRCISKARSIFENTGALSFDEMLYWPVVMDVQPRKMKWVFVDECQDLNILQQILAIRCCAEDGRMCWVGDRRQAIYGFAGADAASFDRIVELTKAEVLPLNVCYRCPSSHIELAKKIVPEIEARPGAPLGEIVFAHADIMHTLMQPGALVMCRLTSPLVSAYFRLIQNRIAAKVLGRDLGKDLANTLDKVAELDGFRYDKIIEFLNKYHRLQKHMLGQKENSEAQLQALDDKIECLEVCATNFSGCTSLKDLKAELEKLFGDEDDKDTDWKKLVTLCTVHRAKGLEADETFILEPQKMPLIRPKQSAWELAQEWNIKYVALTRAKKKLTIFGTPDSIGLIPEAAKPAIVTIPKPSPVGEKAETSYLEVATAMKRGEVKPLADIDDEAPDLDSVIGQDDDGAIEAAEEAAMSAMWNDDLDIHDDEDDVADEPDEPKPAPSKVLHISGVKPGSPLHNHLKREREEKRTEAAAQPQPAPTPQVELTPVPAQPKSKLEAVAASMTVEEIDRLIAVLTKVRSEKAQA